MYGASKDIYGSIHSSALHDNLQLAITQRFHGRMDKLQDIHTAKCNSENEQKKASYRNADHSPHLSVDLEKSV